MFKIIQRIKSVTKTLFCFSVACFLVPILLVFFLCVHFANKFWLSCLSAKYSVYEISRSKKIRSLIDTTRNAAIFHFLLEVNGRCDFEKIKDHYVNHLIERRNKTGEIRFPKLRRKLISCWGHYAWVKDDSDFNINNHLVLSARTYRGRPVNETNIQEFVSDLITKYLPPEIPPWQVIIIPINTPTSPGSASSLAAESEQTEDENFFILVRIHHLLLAEETDLHVSELLMLSSDKSIQLYDTLTESPKLTDFITKPYHIPNLWNHILITASNRWNEFIYHYDPLESPDFDKRQQIKSSSQLISILFITAVTVLLDFIKGYSKTNNHIKYKLKYLINLWKREAYKRNLTTQAVIDSTLSSMNPINIFRNFVRICWWLTVTFLFLWPYYAYCELYALKELIFTGHTDPSNNTFIGFLSIYFPLFYYASIELLQIITEIVQTPRNIYEELFVSRCKEGNILQVKSYCGRKVISFSKPINMETVRERINLEEIGETEFILACLGGSLQKYLQEFRDYRVPSMLNITYRSIGKEYFLEKYDKSAHIGGVVFLQLPLQIPNPSQVDCIRKIIERVRRKQIAIYLLAIGQVKFELITSIFPEVWMKVFINYFSNNFPVTLTEIYGDSAKMQVSWGQTVKDLLFFRPPQSKTCLSLSIHRFGNRSRLSIMADTQLAPEHIKISSSWENFMETITFQC